MSDVLLLIHGLMKAGLVVGVMVLVTTWPVRSSAAGLVVQQGGLLLAGLYGASAATRCARTTESVTEHEVDDSIAKSGAALEPISLLDAYEPEAGYARPGTVSRIAEDGWDSDFDRFEPICNTDGTMMVGDFDTNGNMYGVTDSHFDAWHSTTTSSMWDD